MERETPSSIELAGFVINFIIIMGSDQIVKGKRTKRQRFDLAVTDSSSSTGYSGEESTEEEEDMANCLIMLAQGDSHRPSPKQIIQESSGVKAGLYVYECKTCNRSFPSFQALGGHRASHKKPKATLESEKKSSPSSIFVAAVVTIKDDFNKGNKIHECSICGSEFTSGQALGGHMRRHRAAAVANTNNNQLTTSNIGEVKPTRSILPLDLNLPAPEDDHHIGRFGTTHQSSSLVVFSAPALVDCHY